MKDLRQLQEFEDAMLRASKRIEICYKQLIERINSMSSVNPIVINGTKKGGTN